MLAFMAVHPNVDISVCYVLIAVIVALTLRYYYKKSSDTGV